MTLPSTSWIPHRVGIHLEARDRYLLQPREARTVRHAPCFLARDVVPPMPSAGCRRPRWSLTSASKPTHASTRTPLPWRSNPILSPLDRCGPPSPTTPTASFIHLSNSFPKNPTKHQPVQHGVPLRPEGAAWPWHHRGTEPPTVSTSKAIRSSSFGSWHDT
jgi:hypothetical protein